MPLSSAPSQPGLAVLVNGPSSCGKSTLCRALHARLTGLAGDDPARHFGRVAFDDVVLLVDETMFRTLAAQC